MDVMYLQPDANKCILLQSGTSNSTYVRTYFIEAYYMHICICTDFNVREVRGMSAVLYCLYCTMHGVHGCIQGTV